LKAVICTRYGPPEVLQLREVERPVPKDDEILIRVYATTVTSGDVWIRSSKYDAWFWPVGRLLYGVFRPRKKIPGNELAGVVEAVGRNIKLFREGDQVYGMIWETSFGGTYAEYKSLRESYAAIKPANMSFEEAAAVPIGGLTALHLLRQGGVREGQRVLIYGASGSVGTFAVQLASHFGAEVTGVCSTANVDIVRSLGACDVLDYTKEDFRESGRTWDIIFDAVRKTSFSRCRNSLTRDGVFVTVDFPILQALWAWIAGGGKIVFGTARRHREDLDFLRGLIEAEKLSTVIDKTYPLQAAAAAHRYVEKGHKKGNVILTLGHR
jgi:NADPH:quinone reductase-like Zn-dependent oxidoreductase